MDPPASLDRRLGWDAHGVGETIWGRAGAAAALDPQSQPTGELDQTAQSSALVAECAGVLMARLWHEACSALEFDPIAAEATGGLTAAPRRRAGDGESNQRSSFSASEALSGKLRVSCRKRQTSS